MGGQAAAESVTLYAAITGLAGTLLGFAITSLSVLLGVFKSPEFSLLRKQPDYDSVFADCRHAIALLAITTLLALGATVAAAAQFYSPTLLGITLGFVALSSVGMTFASEILMLAIKAHVNSDREI